jgi:hypothetical protein
MSLGTTRRLLIAFALLLAPIPVLAQGTFSTIRSSPEPLPNCTPAVQGQPQPIVWDTTAQKYAGCIASNTWSFFTLVGQANAFTGNNSFPNLVSPTLGASLGQQHTIPAVTSDIFGLLAAAQTFTNKTFDVTLNTLKTATNTAGHYLRNNGTQYVDNTIQAADVPAINLAAAGNGGVTNNLPVAQIAPGTNGQCVLTSAGASTWGSCAGTAGVQTLNVNTTPVTVNASTTSPQTMMSYPVIGGTLNSLTKSFRARATGIWTPLNTSESVTISMALGSVTISTQSFSATNASVGQFYFDILCSVSTAGASGILRCTGANVATNGGFPSFADAGGSGGVGPVDLTVNEALTVQISFTTASATNTATQRHMVVEQLN